VAVPPGKDEAQKLIQACIEEDRFFQTAEFRQRLRQRHYTIQDVYRVLRTGKIDKAVSWREDHGNFEVRVRGRASDGRRTRVVLGLSENFRQLVLVTVINLD